VEKGDFVTDANYWKSCKSDWEKCIGDFHGERSPREGKAREFMGIGQFGLRIIAPIFKNFSSRSSRRPQAREILPCRGMFMLWQAADSSENHLTQGLWSLNASRISYMQGKHSENKILSNEEFVNDSCKDTGIGNIWWVKNCRNYVIQLCSLKWRAAIRSRQ
jgi:hypothetical protein